MVIGSIIVSAVTPKIPIEKLDASGLSNISDVDKFTEAAERLVGQGIVKGRSVNEADEVVIDVAAKITQQEMALFIARATADEVGDAATDEAILNDENISSESLVTLLEAADMLLSAGEETVEFEPEDIMHEAAERGLFDGLIDDFADEPSHEITRGEAMQLVYNFVTDDVGSEVETPSFEEDETAAESEEEAPAPTTEMPETLSVYSADAEAASDMANSFPDAVVSNTGSIVTLDMSVMMGNAVQIPYTWDNLEYRMIGFQLAINHVVDVLGASEEEAVTANAESLAELLQAKKI